MKNALTFFFGILLMASCTQAPEGQQVEATDAEAVPEITQVDTLNIDTNQSLINWVGTEPGDEGHSGDIKIKSGTLLVQGETIAGGSFVIDMNSINVTDLEGGKKAKLESHLKDNDFFEANKYPEAEFTITKVTPSSVDTLANHIVTGNLMMKDSLKSIKIPAMVTFKNGSISASTPQFTIDRTEWGVVYRSGIIGTIKDKLIDDQIGLKINLVAAK